MRFYVINLYFVLIIFPQMEQKQSVAFLTDVIEIQQQNVIKQKIEISTLRHNIKILAHQFPPREIITQVLANLGLSYSIVTFGLNLDREKNLTLSDLKRIYFQLKMIQRETIRLKNCNNLQVGRVGKDVKSSASSRSVNNYADRQRNILRYSRSNLKLESECQNDELKKQILKEISYRKLVADLNKSNHSDKHKEFLLSKVKKAKLMNKQSEKIHQKNTLLQKQNYEEIFNKLKLVEHEDYSIWANRSGRNALIVSKFRARSTNHPSQQIKLKKNYSKDHLVSQRSAKFQEISTISFQQNYYKKPSSLRIRKNSCSNQEVRLALQTSEIKRRNVLQRKNQYDQQKFNKALQNVVMKNMTIESIQKKLVTEKESVEKEEKQKNTDSDIFKVTSSFVTEVNNYEKGNKIDKKIQEKIMRKQEINQRKSQKLKETFSRNRQRFLWRRMQIDKQNQEKIRLRNEQEMSFREINQGKIKSKQLRIQKIIRKTRQKMQLKQVFSEQISNLKKLSDQSLQKKLRDCQKKGSTIKP